MLYQTSAAHKIFLLDELNLTVNSGLNSVTDRVKVGGEAVTSDFYSNWTLQSRSSLFSPLTQAPPRISGHRLVKLPVSAPHPLSRA